MQVASEGTPKERPPRRDPQVFADPCRECKSANTRVYRTMAIVRYCKCKKCGHTWTQTEASAAG